MTAPTAPGASQIVTEPRAILIGSHAAHAPEWHALRASGIGGSEVAAILGLSPWQSPFSLWHAKRNGWIDPPSSEMEWGTYLEPALLAWYFDHHGRRAGLPDGTWRHPERDWQIANPDALALDEAGELTVVEAKKASSDDAWGDPGTDAIPPYYRTQVVWYMDVLGARQADVVVTNLGRSPVVYRIGYIEDEAAYIRSRAEEFWLSLQQDVPPPLDGTTATYQTVRRLHPGIDGSVVTVSKDIGLRWLLAKRELDDASAVHREATAALLEAMGEARLAVLDDGTPVARRQPSSRGSISLHALIRADQGDTAA